MKVPLLEYLDKLEATVKAAPQGDWSAPQGGWPSSRYGEVISNEQPITEGYGGRLITESCDRLVAPHIVATQPKATLALIAKLRAAIQLLDDMNVGCTPFDERWFALQQIEVAEIGTLRARVAELEAELEHVRGIVFDVDMRDAIQALLKSEMSAGELRRALGELVR